MFFNDSISFTGSIIDGRFLNTTNSASTKFTMPDITNAARLQNTTSQPNSLSNSSRNAILTINPKTQEMLKMAKRVIKVFMFFIDIRLLHTQ
jgi:hypothetical protein